MQGQQHLRDLWLDTEPIISLARVVKESFGENSRRLSRDFSQASKRVQAVLDGKRPSDLWRIPG